ncbi:MAG: DoxX family protein [Gemmatimonadaceae bacterium]
MQRETTPDTATNWAIRVSVAIVFSLVGVEKIVPRLASYWVQTFETIGLGQWFRYVTGIMEMVGGLLFLVPAATTIGAAMLIATMCGAMAVQAFVFKHPGDAIFPGAYLVGVALAFMRLRKT